MNTKSALLFVGLALACREPFSVVPGGKLEGEVRAAALALPDGFGTAQLETRPQDPYSVNITYTVVGGRVYVNAGDSETTWATNLKTDPRARLRVDGALYELRATRVTDRDEIARFAAAWLGQSSTREDPTTLDEVWLYRLDEQAEVGL